MEGFQLAAWYRGSRVSQDMGIPGAEFGFVPPAKSSGNGFSGHCNINKGFQNCSLNCDMSLKNQLTESL